jgi:SET family sugar efflux transporter-like MFS transporter
MVAFALFQAAMITAMTTTTLFATETLHLSALWGGLALSIAAGLEVPVLLWLRTSADRGDEFATMKKAALVGVLYYLLMATAAGSVELLAVQVLNALFVAVVAGTGLTLFQRIVGMPGAAAGLQGNASRVGTTMTGPILALGANHWIGLRAVFLVAALCALVGGAAVALVHRSFRARAALIGVAS